jgi:hypothetical protein
MGWFITLSLSSHFKISEAFNEQSIVEVSFGVLANGNSRLEKKQVDVVSNCLGLGLFYTQNERELKIQILPHHYGWALHGRFS